MNYKKIAVLSVLVLFAGFVHAQEDVAGTMVKPEPRTGIRQDIKDLREDKREKRVDDRKEVISNLKAKTDELRETRKTQIEAAGTKEDKVKIREDIKAEIKAKREDAKKELAEKREERQTAFKEEVAKIKTQKLEARKTFASERFSAAITAITQKQVKVQTFLDNRKTQGVDITKSLEYLASSKDYLGKAQTALTEMKSLDASTEANKTLIKNAAQKVEENLKNSRSELVLSVQAATQTSTTSASQ